VFATFGHLAGNATSGVGFASTLHATRNGVLDDTGVYLGGESAPIQIAREGDPAPDGDGDFAGFGSAAVNDAGQVAFYAELRGTAGGSADDRGVFRVDAGEVVTIIREGDAAPDGDGVFASVPGYYAESRRAALNGAGQVAFRAELTGTHAGQYDDSGILLGDGHTLMQIAREGDVAPDGNGHFVDLSGEPAINDAGQVAFHAGLAGTVGGDNDSDGIFRGDGTTLVQILRAGRVCPDYNGTMAWFSNPAMTDQGTIACYAQLTGTLGGFSDDQAVYLADAHQVVQVARTGDALLGSTVTDLEVSNGDPTEGTAANGLNDLGQVVYHAQLADGRSAVFRFTPDLHWRGAAEGAWDDPRNWTVGLRPGISHRVVIDPEMEATISGPDQPVAIAALIVGRHSGEIVRLVLSETGPMTAADGATIAEYGELLGRGSVVGEVRNDGVVGPGVLTIDGAYTQTPSGDLMVEIGGPVAGDDYDTLTVTGTATLDGILWVVLVDGFVPSVGDTFDVVVGGSGLAGEFSSNVGLDLGNGLVLVPEYLPDRLRLVTTAVPLPVGP